MAAGTPKSAKNAKVRIGAVGGGQNFVLYAASWKVEPEVNYDDTTSFEDQGFETQAPCVAKATVEISGFFDAGANPYDGPPQIRPGSQISAKLFLEDGAPAWDFPKLDITTAPMTAEVKGVLKITINGKAWGSFSYPTGNF
jgi:hypothetical protein